MQWNVCDQISYSPKDPGDYVGRVFVPLDFDLAPNKTEKLTFVYQRF
jgi:hypothetical protein